MKGSTNFNGDFTGRFPSDLKYAKDSVTSIDLRKMPPGHGVYGSLPTQLGRFRVLTSVRVQQNDVAGTLPTQIGALAVPLTELLEVWGNAEMGGPSRRSSGPARPHGLARPRRAPGWQGQLPSEIGQLSLLEDRLVLTNPRGGNRNGNGNDDEDEDEGRYRSGAERAPADASGLADEAAGAQPGGPRLTGPLPTEIGMLSDLRRGLVLQGNNFGGQMPTELGKLTKLQVIIIKRLSFAPPLLLLLHDPVLSTIVVVVVVVIIIII